MISSRGDSRLWLFILANVQETDCDVIIGLRVWSQQIAVLGLASLWAHF
jgi:hypothetical protein